MSDDDGAFVPPSRGGRSQLTALFAGGGGGGGDDDGDVLSYSAPKAQPRKEASAPSPSLATAATPAVLAAASVHVYKLNNGAYETVGAAGMVVLGGANLQHNILVYDSAKKPIVQAPIHAEFTLPLQEGNYCSVTDAAGALFSVRFNSPEDQAKIARAAAIGRVMAWKSGGSLVVQDLVLGKGQDIASGDSVAVKYTGWLPGASGPASIGEVFDSNEGAQGKPFKFQIGISKVIQGWHLGVAGMKKDGRRFLAIPSGLGYGANGAPPKIPPNSTLFFEIFVDKVKFEPAAAVAADPPASAQSAQSTDAVSASSPAAATAPLSQEEQEKEALKARMAKLSHKGGGSSMGAMQGNEPRRESVNVERASPSITAQAAPTPHQQPQYDAIESTAVVAVSTHPVGTFEKYSQQQQQQQQQQQHQQHQPQFQNAQQFQQPVLQPMAPIVAALPSETVSDVKAISSKVDKIGIDVQILLDRTKIEKKDDAASMVGQALVHSVTRMVEDNEKLRTDISEKSLRLDELSRRVTELTETNRRLDDRLKNFSTDVSDREVTSGMKSRFEVMESDMQLLRTRIAEAEARLKDATQQLHEAKKDKGEALDRIQSLTEEIEEAKRGAQRLTKQLDERKAKMQSERDSYESRLEEQNSTHEAEVTKLKDQLHKAKLQSSRGGDDEIKKQVDEAEARWARTLDESKAAWETERRALKNEIANLLKPQAPKESADPIIELQRQALAQATEEHAKQLIQLRAQADADALEKASTIASLSEKLQVATSEVDAAKQRVSALESDLAAASQNYTNAVAESASASSSASGEITKLRSEVVAAKAAQKDAEASLIAMKAALDSKDTEAESFKATISQAEATMVQFSEQSQASQDQLLEEGKRKLTKLKEQHKKKIAQLKTDHCASVEGVYTSLEQLVERDQTYEAVVILDALRASVDEAKQSIGSGGQETHD